MTEHRLPDAPAVRTLAAPYGHAAAIEVECPRCGRLHRHRYTPGDTLLRASACGRGDYRILFAEDGRG